MNSSNNKVSHTATSRGVFFLILFTVLGGVLGMGLFSTVFGGSEAEGILNLGYTPDGSARILLEQPVSLMTRVSTEQFVMKVADRIHDHSVVRSLLARQYGGFGKLQIRPLRDGLQMEIRVRSKSVAMALDITNAVMDEVIAEHVVLADKLISTSSKAMEQYKKIIADGEQSEDFLNKQLEDPSHFIDKPALYSMLLSAKAGAQQQVLGANGSLYALEKNLPIQTEIVSGPTILKPTLTSPWQTAVLGALAGFAVGFVLLQMRKMIV